MLFFSKAQSLDSLLKGRGRVSTGSVLGSLEGGKTFTTTVVVSAETIKSRLLRPCLVLRLLDPAAWLLREQWDRLIGGKTDMLETELEECFEPISQDLIQTGIHFTYFVTLGLGQ